MKIYNIIYRPITNLLGALLYPISLFNKRIREHTGRVIRQLDSSIWIHASSVGEVNGIRPFIEKVLAFYPDEKIVVTTMTTTGKEVASKISSRLIVGLVPFDSPLFVKSFLKRIKPKLLVIAETELWFSMINECFQRKIPIMLANARLSDKSFPKYLKYKIIFSTLLTKIAIVVAQSELDRERFLKVGAKNVVTGGNIKFSVNLPDYNSQEIRKKYGFAPEDLIITWGSSRPGEEDLFIRIFKALLPDFPNLKLIIVLRHIQRVKEVTANLDSQAYTTFSDFTPNKKILIVDAMGVLNQLYACSDIAIVGGSFFDFGGHNPLEPAYYSKPIIMGNYHSSCLDSIEKLIEQDAIVISSETSLLADLKELLTNSELREEMGKQAKRTLALHSQAVENNFHQFEQLLAQAVLPNNG